MPVLTIAQRKFARWLLTVALVECLAAPLFAQSVATEPPLELPKLIVTDQRKLLPRESWRYAQIPGLEILSGASDRETRKLLRDFRLFNEAIDVVWPALKDHRPVPLSLLLCGAGKFEAFRPVHGRAITDAPTAILLKDAEQATLILNFGVKVLNAGTSSFSLQVDYFAELNHEYVRYLLSYLQPHLPAWLEEGLAQLLMGMRVESRFIEFAKIEDPNLVPIALKMHDPNQPMIPGMIPVDPPDFNKALARHGLIPLGQFFAVGRNSPLARNSTHGRWGKQAKGLVHMWLYGENGRYNQAFARFVARINTEPVTEAMFKECFKMSYDEMLTVFRIYINNTAYKYQQFQAPKGRGLPEPAGLALRDATPAEIGRLKGEAHLQAGHADAAWEEFLAPYFRGQSDASLLASLGLFENNRGEFARARKFLEAAAKQNVVRPRAYLELANLRFAEARRTPNSTDSAPLTADQTKAVLQPLLIARQQPPPIPEVYELMAEVWLHSSIAPAKSDLGAINQGVLLFQRRPVLLLRAAELNGKYGDPAEARLMANFGIKLSQTPDARQAFEDVKASLPPVTPK